jgi:hypothetical protein
MGETWHITVFIVGHRSGWCQSGSCRAPWLATASTASSVALAALTLVSEGCGHHIWSLLLFWRILPFIAVVPLSSILDGRSLQRLAGVIVGGRVSFPSFLSRNRRWRSSWPLSKLSMNARMADSSVTPSQEFFISSHHARKVWEVSSLARRHLWRSPMLWGLL